MLVLIIGGSASGKSEYAEQLAVSGNHSRVYLATMRSGDAECERRIQKHRAARAHRGFVTVECQQNLHLIMLPAGTHTVLLEDLGNWLNNLLFDGNYSMDAATAIILRGVEHLSAQCQRLIVVSNEICMDENDYGEYTNVYRRTLAHLHQKLAAKAQLAVEVTAGCPVVHKRKE